MGDFVWEIRKEIEEKGNNKVTLFVFNDNEEDRGLKTVSKLTSKQD